MNVAINYNLPDDDYNYHCSYHSVTAFNTIHDVYNTLRSHLKHGDPKDHQKILEQVYEEITYLHDLVG